MGWVENCLTWKAHICTSLLIGLWERVGGWVFAGKGALLAKLLWNGGNIAASLTVDGSQKEIFSVYMDTLVYKFKIVSLSSFTLNIRVSNRLL